MSRNYSSDPSQRGVDEVSSVETTCALGRRQRDEETLPSKLALDIQYRQAASTFKHARSKYDRLVCCYELVCYVPRLVTAHAKA
jgi:hypothetical protein